MTTSHPHWPLPSVFSAAIALAGCGRQETKAEASPRPVRPATVSQQGIAETATLTGHVEAEDEAALSFRIAGRMIVRVARVGGRAAVVGVPA
ncbi:MAG: hypothetical protein ACREFP_03970 [Acetobacteraceae bacterium]